MFELNRFSIVDVSLLITSKCLTTVLFTGRLPHSRCHNDGVTRPHFSSTTFLRLKCMKSVIG